MNEELEENLKEYIEYKNKDFENAKDLIKYIGDFTITDISSLTEIFFDFKFKHVLYYFEIPTNITALKICEVIDTEKKKVKKAKEEFKLPKVNFKNAEIPNNKILYVGKSSGNFSTRLKQHIGRGSRKTYALHLKEWNKLFGKEISVKLHYVSFEKKMDESNKHLLELLETSLHYKLKPILGRTGH